MLSKKQDIATKQRIETRIKNKIEEIKEIVEKERYKVVCIERRQLKRVYQGRQDYVYTINCICPNDHGQKIAWNRWKRGTRCPICEASKKAEEITKKAKKKKCVTVTIRYK